MKDDNLIVSTTFLWEEALKKYDDRLIIDAGVKATAMYHYPPSIKQFVDLCESMQPTKHIAVCHVAFEDMPKTEHRAPEPSPLLAEFMRQKGIKDVKPKQSIVCSEEK